MNSALGVTKVTKSFSADSLIEDQNGIHNGFI